MLKIRFLTAGESHGKGLLGILDGIPANLALSEDDIARQLARRQLGYGRGGRMKIEQDRAEIYAGVRYGMTTGAPIGLLIPNRDWKNRETQMSVAKPEHPVEPVTLPRPGHADLAGVQKFGFTDIRNVLERASARETAMRVALGTIGRQLLKNVGIEVGSRVVQIHAAMDSSDLPEALAPEEMNALADQSPVRCLNQAIEKQMVAAIAAARRAGDSVGGVFELVATGLPYGLGSCAQWDRKLPGRLAGALMSINALKGFEVGTGFQQAAQRGSAVHDEIAYQADRFSRGSNRAGGIEGGMSNAQPIRLRVAMKPLPTLVKPLQSADIVTGEPRPAHVERTDSCAVPAASIVGESMLCLVLTDALLEKFGGDSVPQLKAHMAASARY